MSENLDYGKKLFAEGKVDEAQSFFDAILRKEPENLDALNYLGIASFQAGEFEKAMLTFTSALKIDPFSKNSVLNFVEVCKHLDCVHLAEPFVKKILYKFPDDKTLNSVVNKPDRISAELNNGKSNKLNLGCGRTIMDGWVNLDSVKLTGVDVVADLDKCEHIPLPFEDNRFEEIYASHLIEHLNNPLFLMQELHRISKNGAKALFKVPYGSSDAAYEDPTHARHYFLNSFGYFSQPYYWRADYGYSGDWCVEKITLCVDRERYSGRSSEDILHEVNTFRNVVLEMIVELRSVKPIRECKKELQVDHELVLQLI